jgi:DNA end-binding protein Ku
MAKTASRKPSAPDGITHPRAWRSLTLGFGLANVGVSIGTLTDERRSGGRKVCEDHLKPVSQRWWCEEGEHIIEREVDGEADTVYSPVTGYEVDNDRFVILSPEEMASIKEQTQTRVEIDQVIPAESLDPAFYRNTYLMWPQSGSGFGQAFDLLALAMQKSKTALAGTAIVTNTTELMVVRWSDHFEVMMAHMCHFDEEIRHAHIQMIRAGREARPAPPKKDLALATPQLKHLMGRFDPTMVEDAFRKALKQEIARKAKGGKRKPAKKAVAVPEIDLLAALKESVEDMRERREKAA